MKVTAKERRRVNEENTGKRMSVWRKNRSI